MSKTSVLTETKTTEVRFYPSKFASMDFLKCDGGISVGVKIAKTQGNYREYGTVTREELIQLINGLTDLLK